MAHTAVPARSEIAEQYTWNAPSVFESPAAWEAEFTRTLESLPAVAAYRGRLHEGPATLLEALSAFEDLYRRIGKVFVYALMNQAVDQTNQESAMAMGRAQGLLGQSLAAIAFLQPELIAIGQDTLVSWMEAEPRLAFLAHYVDDLFRKQAHIRSTEVEQILGMLADPFSGAAEVMSALTNADFHFAPAVTSAGETLDVTQGTLQKILASSDREARRTAWEHYADVYLAYKNTLATNLATSIKQSMFKARVRSHASTLEAALFENAIPTEVFYHLITTFRKHLPTWHRYWAVRRRMLGVETLQPYDIWAPLTTDAPEVPYTQAIDWISNGLAPMGEAYVETLRKGALEQRWVDVYPNRGKQAGAFSAGWYGTYPFIMISYTDNLFSMSTLAHELGHSMHSYLTWAHQPFLYADYSLFVAEVASNFHQAMVRAHLLDTVTDPIFQINLIEEAMSNFHRYFFIMPTLARFELDVHERVERGEGLSADGMIDLMADLFEEGYGGEMQVDRPRVGITWATFAHLYIDYYVFQYATGISGAHALSKRILSGEPGAVDDYLSFLKAGGSRYPLDALRLAGVDLTSPEPVEITFGILSDLVDRLEQLAGSRGV